MAKITQIKKDPLRAKADLLVIGVHTARDKSFSAVDKKLEGSLGRASARAGDLRLGSCFIADTAGKMPACEVMVAGLGDKKSFSAPGDFFKAASAAVKNCGSRVKKIALDFPVGSSAGALRSVMEGALLGSYGFSKYKSDPAPGKGADEISVFSGAGDTSFGKAAQMAQSVAESVRLCRDLVNEPPVFLTPAVLADCAENMCSGAGLDCSVITPPEMRQKGMGGILAVGGGSANPPRLIHMTYSPAGAKSRRTRQIAIVGKGITFDSGGLSLKPAEAMRTMKMDMSGAAAIVGTMKAVAEIKPPVTVHGIVAAAENMTGASAYRPDDIVKPMNGKTVEIVNTDAEGRVVLADALSYAVTLGAREIIDLATLTGACVIALGINTAGVMGNNEKIVEKVKRSSRATGEPVWELPLLPDLRKDIESDFADIKNAGNRWGGAITAALFLENFVSGTPWAHLDIAGPAYLEKGNDWYPKGATGFGVRTVVDYILSG